MKSNIILLGFMGSGKSSVGKRLSQLIKKNFIDMDENIQHRLGMTIPEIFQQQGESYFRAKERDLVKELDSQSNLVISTGGGIILDRRNMESLSKNGITVYLKCEFHTIVQRIKSEHTRPLFNSEDLTKFEEIFASRILLYEENADVIVNVNEKSVNQAAIEIAESVKKKML